MKTWAAFAVALALGCGSRTEGLCSSCDGPSEDTSTEGDGLAIDDSETDGGFTLDAEPVDPTDAGKPPPSDATPPISADGCPMALPRDASACAVPMTCSYVGCDPKSRDTATCSGGTWNVFSHACTSSSDRCPATVPPDGSECALPPGMFCVWDELCTAGSRGNCVGGRWQTKHGGCGGPELCPSTIPALGSTCPTTAPGTGFGCSYRNACGVPAYAFCAGAKWGAEGGYENPACTPAAGCPSSLPAPTSACSGRTTCVYPNSCGSVDFAQCSGTDWFVSKMACPDTTCPLTPDEGSTCGPKGKKCNYPIGAGCSIDCVCSSVGWTCVQAPCGAGSAGGK